MAAGVAEALAQGEEVGEGLAGVLLVGEGVDDGNAGEAGVLLDDALAEGAHGDDIDVAGEDAGDVLDRLALAEAHLLRCEVEGLAAKVMHADLEADAGSQRRLLEEEGEVLALEQLAGTTLELQGGLQEETDLGGREVGGIKQMSCHSPSVGEGRPTNNARGARRVAGPVTQGFGTIEGPQGCSSVGRASASKSECRGFESCHPCQTLFLRSRGVGPARLPQARVLPTIDGLGPGGGTGRHAVLRGQCPSGRVSSNLTLGTSSSPRRRGQVVRQRSAKPLSPVRFRSAPPPLFPPPIQHQHTGTARIRRLHAEDPA